VTTRTDIDPHYSKKDVLTKLNKLGLPYDITGKRTITVHISSPEHWAPTSLTAMCWRKLEFSYHAAYRNGNKIKCSTN
jgi:hypothetical protein